MILNNPLHLSLIIVSCIIVAVAVILLVAFRKKIADKCAKRKAERKAKKANKAETFNKSVSLASEVFKDAQVVDKEPTKEELDEFDQKIRKMVNDNKRTAVNSANFSNQVNTKKDKGKK